MGNEKTAALALPDFNAEITAELEGLGSYGRITLTLDFCGSKLARYTIARERSIRGAKNGE
jgi:hypothetical protein